MLPVTTSKQTPQFKFEIMDGNVFVKWSMSISWVSSVGGGEEGGALLVARVAIYLEWFLVCFFGVQLFVWVVLVLMIFFFWIQ